jgi:hypothetical protein
MDQQFRYFYYKKNVFNELKNAKNAKFLLKICRIVKSPYFWLCITPVFTKEYVPAEFQSFEQRPFRLTYH